MKRYFLIAVLIGFLFSCAQKEDPAPVEWERYYGSYGEDYFFTVDILADGGLFIAGSRFGDDSNDIGWIVKTDPFGEIEWEKQFDMGTSNSIDVCVDSNQQLIVALTYLDSEKGDSDVSIYCYDQNGDEIYKTAVTDLSNQNGGFIKASADGGVLIGMRTEEDAYGGLDTRLLRLSADGNIMWDRTYGTFDHDYLYDAEFVPGGGIVVCGARFPDEDSSFDHYVALLDDDGEVVWENLYGTDGVEISSDVALTAEGHFLICGCGEALLSDDSGLDYAVYIVDREGVRLSDDAFGTEGYDFALSVLPTADGGFYTAGRSWSIETNYEDVLVIFSDSARETVLEKTFRVSANEFSFPIRFLDIVFDGNEGIIMVGYKQNTTNGIDGWIYRLPVYE